MKFCGAIAVAAAAIALSSSSIVTAEDLPSSSEALVVEAAESVGLLCPAAAACKLEMGVAFGDPWVKAEAGDAGYFEV